MPALSQVKVFGELANQSEPPERLVLPYKLWARALELVQSWHETSPELANPGPVAPDQKGEIDVQAPVGQ